MADRTTVRRAFASLAWLVWLLVGVILAGFNYVAALAWLGGSVMTVVIAILVFYWITD